RRLRQMCFRVISTTPTDSEDYIVDTVPPELGIDLDPIVVGDDNTVNKAEADDKASVTQRCTQRLPHTARYKTTLTRGAQNTKTTKVVDAGNSTTSTDSERYSGDTVAPELGIDLDPIVVGGDNTVNKAEADDKASVTLSGTPPLAKTVSWARSSAFETGWASTSTRSWWEATTPSTKRKRMIRRA
ncbi:hypothetical protein ACA545_02380, partial [Vibrio cholerae]